MQRTHDTYGVPVSDSGWGIADSMQRTGRPHRLNGEDAATRNALMRRRFVAVLLAGLMVLTGCTDVQSAGDDADDPVAGAAGASEGATASSEAAEESEQPAASERAASEASEPDDASTEDAVADDTARDREDEGEDAEDRSRDAGLVAVSRDDRGEDVEALQKRLAKLGFAPGPVDGAYGPQTAAAVEAFQMLSDLKQTGKADARTVAALADFESDVQVLEAGDKGKEVKRLQRRLASGPFDPGPADGEYGGKTVQAVWALEKLAGVPVDGNWGPLDEYALERLESGAVGGPEKKHKKRWVEVDLSQQLMKVYDPGSSEPFLVSHASSGSGIAWSNEGHSGNSITPTGDFVISRRIAGWRESSLDIGRLYNPLYFNGGIAFHGALSVPLYPASHGCIRLPMHIAEYLPGELPNGTPVHVLS
jgi:peptidoglycan hydrolase-like protein with peptidoglycan-binding domain